MLTIRVCKAFSHALGEYLRQADYYSEGMNVEGRCCGRLRQAVGLGETQLITDEAFARIASNRHAVTDEQLTMRMTANRRAGYDAVFNAPKSVSIQTFIGGDERLITAHERAVAEALQELEVSACHQTGQGINKRYVASGGIVAAVFRHGESRVLDPHLHSHAFIFNLTQSASGRLMALESSLIFERTRYLTEVYRNALAREVRRLGYAIEPRPHGFELSGVSPDLLERFSKRAQQRDAAIAARESELDRELTHDEIAVLVRENRAKKQHELTPAKVRQRQLAQVDAEELAHLRGLRPTGGFSLAPEITPDDAIARATEHIFERRTVVSLPEFIAEVIRQSYGQHSLATLKEAIVRDSKLLHADEKISTQAALDLERSLVKQLNAGVGTYSAELGHAVAPSLARLSTEQQCAAQTLLGSFDCVAVLRGRAGTGKTQTLATVIEGMASIGRDVACFAPSTQAVDILKQDGMAQQAEDRVEAAQVLSQANTVQRLLLDTALQRSLAGRTAIVDEYGLLSVRQLKALLDVAKVQRMRLVLVGDSAQHKSVEAGDAARIVETESRVTVAELKEVRRQAVNPAYKAAAEDLAAGRLTTGLCKLDRMGSVVQIENPTARRAQMVEEWHAAAQETKTALMIAPTWAEIDALNVHARGRLRRSGRLSGEEMSFASLRAKDLTKAQQKNIRHYRPGDILVVRKATKHFAKGDELRVVRCEQRRLVVACGPEEFSVSPRQSGLAWTVCEEHVLPVATGERLRLRAISHAQLPDGSIRRLANGTTVTIQSVDAAGRLMLADNSVLHTRQVVHAYAITSHAAQGHTVDRVYIAGATSREGLYVSATRGREGIRIFVPDREEFLRAAGLRSEARMSALEFMRQHRFSAGLRATLARGWRYLQHFRSAFASAVTIEELPAIPTHNLASHEASAESVGQLQPNHAPHVCQRMRP